MLTGTRDESAVAATAEISENAKVESREGLRWEISRRKEKRRPGFFETLGTSNLRRTAPAKSFKLDRYKYLKSY